MPWIRFSEPYNWNVPGLSGTVSVLYKARRYFVKREVADEAIAKSKAVEVPSPREEAAQKVAAKAEAVKSQTKPSGRSRAATAAKRKGRESEAATTRLMTTLAASTANYETALAKSQAETTAKLKRTRKAAPDGESTV